MTNSMRLAVFDLDYTIWQPEMYQIDGPPKRRKAKDDKIKLIVTDQDNKEITVFDGAAYALSKINELRDSSSLSSSNCCYDIQVAIASKTDEPKWAQQCMDWLTIHDGKTLTACIDHIEIGFHDKKWHFQRLKQKTGIEYEEMVFFDNEWGNIVSVKQLGVKCIYTPEGMTREAWHEALQLFGMDC